jgi:O-antigen ligase
MPARLVRVAFYGFMVSMVFEIPERPMPIEVDTLTGSILLAIAVMQPRGCWSSRPFAFWCFALFAWIYVVFGIRTDHEPEMVVNALRLIQLVLLFLVAYNLLLHEQIARNALITFVLACVALYVMQRSGVIMTATTVAGVVRLSALGQNPNMLAHHMALGLTAALGLAAVTRSGPRRIVAWLAAVLAAAPLISTLAYTGSRTGLLSATAGVVVLGLVNARRGQGRVPALALSVAGAVLLTTAVYRAPAMFTRVEIALRTHEMTLREHLYPVAWEMFLQKPLAGWGPVNHMYELESHVPRAELPYRETHNVILELLTETGLLGALPFITAMAFCVVSAWRGRFGPLGALPLALTAAVLVNRMSSAGIYSKAHWLVLAFALAAGPMGQPGGRLGHARRAETQRAAIKRHD